MLDEGLAHIDNSHVFSIWLWDEQERVLRFQDSRGSESSQDRSPIPGGVGVNGWVATHRIICRVNDVDHPVGVIYRRGHRRTHSELVVPMKSNERYFGNLDLGFPEVNGFDDDDIALVEGIADQVANALYRLEINQAGQQTEQRARNAEFMGSVGQSAFELAHRLGNELGLVRTYVNGIEDTLGPEQTAQIAQELGNIVADVSRVLRLSSELKASLAESREYREIRTEPIAVPPIALLQECAARVSGLPKNILIQYDIAPDIADVMAVQTQVADILRNLFANAIDAMPNGGTITLRARNTRREVELQVIDTGTGISKEHQSRVFDLFYSTKGSFGFGLWSARRMALANGGDLRVESEPGKGATFTLSLPQMNRGEG